MATQTLRPDSVLSNSGLVANTISDHNQDPDSVSTTVAPVSTSTNTEWGADFPTPTGPPSVGAGLQEFRAGVIESGLGIPQVRLELWENGSLIRAQTDTALAPGYNVVSMTWDASELSTVDGSLVQCKVIGTAGAGGATAIGNVEWNAVYSGAALTADPGDVSVAGKTATFDEVDVVVADPGDVSVAGKTATFDEIEVVRFSADPGDVSVAGKTATFNEVEVVRFSADPGDVSVAGKTAGFTTLDVIMFPAEPAALVVDGKTATFIEIEVVRFSAEPAALIIDGNDAVTRTVTPLQSTGFCCCDCGNAAEVLDDDLLGFIVEGFVEAWAGDTYGGFWVADLNDPLGIYQPFENPAPAYADVTITGGILKIEITDGGSYPAASGIGVAGQALIIPVDDGALRTRYFYQFEVPNLPTIIGAAYGGSRAGVNSFAYDFTPFNSNLGGLYVTAAGDLVTQAGATVATGLSGGEIIRCELDGQTLRHEFFIDGVLIYSVYHDVFGISQPYNGDLKCQHIEVSAYVTANNTLGSTAEIGEVSAGFIKPVWNAVALDPATFTYGGAWATDGPNGAKIVGTSTDDGDALTIPLTGLVPGREYGVTFQDKTTEPNQEIFSQFDPGLNPPDSPFYSLGNGAPVYDRQLNTVGGTQKIARFKIAFGGATSGDLDLLFEYAGANPPHTHQLHNFRLLELDEWNGGETYS